MPSSDDTSAPRVQIDAAKRVWAVAKSHLDKILDQDASLEAVLDEVNDYVMRRRMKRLKAKASGRQVMHLVFTGRGEVISAKPVPDGEVFSVVPTISISTDSKSRLCAELRLISAGKLADAVWKQATAVEVAQ